MVESCTSEPYGCTERTVEEGSIRLRDIPDDGSVSDEAVYTSNQKVDEE